MMISSKNNGCINEIINDSNCFIVMNKCENDILSKIMYGIIVNVDKKLDGLVPIVINDEKSFTTGTPELLYYRNQKLVGSLKGIRQVSEIIKFINKMNL